MTCCGMIVLTLSVRSCLESPASFAPRTVEDSIADYCALSVFLFGLALAYVG
jgi:hypothetical protein